MWEAWHLLRLPIASRVCMKRDTRDVAVLNRLRANTRVVSPCFGQPPRLCGATNESPRSTHASCAAGFL